MEPVIRGAARARQVDDIAEELPQRAATSPRLFLTHTSFGVSRTEAGVMRAVANTPQRITDLAAGEGVTQAAITLLVNRFEDGGWSSGAAGSSGHSPWRSARSVGELDAVGTAGV